MPSLFQLLFILGILSLITFAPILFLFSLWSDRRRFSTGHWALLTGVVFVGATFARMPLVSVLAAIVLIAIGIAWLWQRAILADLIYSRSFGKTHLFPGEQTSVTWTINNDKPLPISWLHWQEAVTLQPFGAVKTEGIRLEGVEIRSVLDGQVSGLDHVTSVSGFQTLVKKGTIHAFRRGYYPFGPVKWEGTDVTGLYTATNETRDVSAVTVYPRLVNLEHLDMPMAALLGDIRQRSLMEDPSWYRGPRQYRASDPMKSVDWKATARMGALHVKTFEPTVHPKLMLVANLHAFERISDGVITERMEDVISTTASLAKLAIEAGFEVGVHSNGGLPETNVPQRIPPSAEGHQLFAILDYLARITLIVDRRIEDVLEADLHNLAQGTALIVCSSVVTPTMIPVLASAARRRPVVLLLVDNEAKVSIPRVTVSRARIVERAAA